MMRRLQNIDNWGVFYLLVAITLASSVGSAIANIDGADRIWWSGWLQNFSTEMMGAIATFALIEVIVGTRNEKENLLVQMKSQDKAIIQRALEQYRTKFGLVNAKLHGAKLHGVDLWGANLRAADLRAADLEVANLQDVNLQAANLEGADLRGADLHGANLQEANLRGANLHGASLWAADLERTTLPDGTKWTHETDMSRFTDSNYPDFWKPE